MLQNHSDVDKDACRRKIEDMQKYVPFLEKMMAKIERTKDRQDLKHQFNKFESLRDMLTAKKKIYSMEALLKAESVITQVQDKLKCSKDDLGDAYCNVESGKPETVPVSSCTRVVPTTTVTQTTPTTSTTRVTVSDAKMNLVQHDKEPVPLTKILKEIAKPLPSPNTVVVADKKDTSDSPSSVMTDLDGFEITKPVVSPTHLPNLKPSLLEQSRLKLRSSLAMQLSANNSTDEKLPSEVDKSEEKGTDKGKESESGQKLSKREERRKRRKQRRLMKRKSAQQGVDITDDSALRDFVRENKSTLPHLSNMPLDELREHLKLVQNNPMFDPDLDDISLSNLESDGLEDISEDELYQPPDFYCKSTFKTVVNKTDIKDVKVVSKVSKENKHRSKHRSNSQDSRSHKTHKTNDEEKTLEVRKSSPVDKGEQNVGKDKPKTDPLKVAKNNTVDKGEQNLTIDKQKSEVSKIGGCCKKEQNLRTEKPKTPELTLVKEKQKNDALKVTMNSTISKNDRQLTKNNPKTTEDKLKSNEAQKSLKNLDGKSKYFETQNNPEKTETETLPKEKKADNNGLKSDVKNKEVVIAESKKTEGKCTKSDLKVVKDSSKSDNKECSKPGGKNTKEGSKNDLKVVKDSSKSDSKEISKPEGQSVKDALKSDIIITNATIKSDKKVVKHTEVTGMKDKTKQDVKTTKENSKSESKEVLKSAKENVKIKSDGKVSKSPGNVGKQTTKTELNKEIEKNLKTKADIANETKSKSDSSKSSNISKTKQDDASKGNKDKEKEKAKKESVSKPKEDEKINLNISKSNKSKIEAPKSKVTEAVNDVKMVGRKEQDSLSVTKKKVESEVKCSSASVDKNKSRTEVSFNFYSSGNVENKCVNKSDTNLEHDYLKAVTDDISSKLGDFSSEDEFEDYALDLLENNKVPPESVKHQEVLGDEIVKQQEQLRPKPKRLSLLDLPFPKMDELPELLSGSNLEQSRRDPRRVFPMAVTYHVKQPPILTPPKQPLLPNPPLQPTLQIPTKQPLLPTPARPPLLPTPVSPHAFPIEVVPSVARPEWGVSSHSPSALQPGPVWGVSHSWQAENYRQAIPVIQPSAGPHVAKSYAEHKEMKRKQAAAAAAAAARQKAQNEISITGSQYGGDSIRSPDDKSDAKSIRLSVDGENFVSPLGCLYDKNVTLKTGRGYGYQAFKYTKINDVHPRAGENVNQVGPSIRDPRLHRDGQNKSGEVTRPHDTQNQDVYIDNSQKNQNYENLKELSIILSPLRNVNKGEIYTVQDKSEDNDSVDNSSQTGEQINLIESEGEEYDRRKHNELESAEVLKSTPESRVVEVPPGVFRSGSDPVSDSLEHTNAVLEPSKDNSRQMTQVFESIEPTKAVHPSKENKEQTSQGTEPINVCLGQNPDEVSEQTTEKLQEAKKFVEPLKVKPTKVVVEPAKDVSKPMKENDVSEPAKENVEPTKEVFEPAKENVEPTKEVLGPAKESVEPTTEVLEPAKENVEPTKQVLEPATENVEPTKEVIEPAKENVEPTKEVLEPAKENVEAAKEISLPARENVEKSKEASEPAKENLEQSKESSELVKETEKKIERNEELQGTTKILTEKLIEVAIAETSKQLLGDNKSQSEEKSVALELTHELVAAYLKKTLGDGNLLSTLKKLKKWSHVIEESSDESSSKKRKKKKRRRSSSSSSSSSSTSSSSTSSSSTSSSSSDAENTKEKKSRKKKKKKKKSKHGRKKETKKEEVPSAIKNVEVVPEPVKITIEKGEKESEPTSPIEEAVEDKNVDEKAGEAPAISTDQEPKIVIRPTVQKNKRNTTKFAARRRFLNRGLRNAKKSGQINKLRCAKAAPLTKSPKQKKNELDKLHDDIRSMFISEGVVSAVGPRTCRLLKENTNSNDSESMPGTSKTCLTGVEQTIERVEIDRATDNSVATPQPVAVKPVENQKNRRFLEYPRIVIKKLESDGRNGRNVARRGGRRTVSPRQTQTSKDSNQETDEVKPCQFFLKRNLLKSKRCKIKKPKMIVRKENISNVVDKIYKRLKIANKSTTKLDDLFDNKLNIERMTDKTLELLSHAFEKNKSEYECLLCNKKLKSISYHYKSIHPESEVLISRLEKTEAEDAICEAREDGLSRLDSKLSLELIKARVKSKLEQRMFNCRMCVFEVAEVLPFFKHVTVHTGEYRYKCPVDSCDFVARTNDGVKNHVVVKHNDKKDLCNKYVESSLPVIENNQLYGFICSLCHYVQTQEYNLEKHCLIAHDNKNCEIIKIRMSSRSKEVPKRAEVTDTVVEPVEPPADKQESPDKGEQRRYPIRSMRTEEPLLELPDPEPKKKKRKVDEEEMRGEEDGNVVTGEAQLTSAMSTDKTTKPNESLENKKLTNFEKKVPKLVALEQALNEINKKSKRILKDDPKKILRGKLGCNELLNEVKMGPLGAQLTPNGKLKYTCYVKSCIFVSCSYELFERHVLLTHTRNRWDGKCSSCCIDLGKSPRLNEALQHLKFHERSEDDVYDASGVDVTLEGDESCGDSDITELPDSTSGVEPQLETTSGDVEDELGTLSAEADIVGATARGERLSVDENCDADSTVDEVPVEPVRIRVKLMEGDRLSKPKSSSPITIRSSPTPPPVAANAVDQIQPITAADSSILPRDQIRTVRAPSDMNKTQTVSLLSSSQCILEKNPILNSKLGLIKKHRMSTGEQALEDKMKHDAVVNKDEEIYKSMLTDERLRDLYKCMAYECSFTTNLEYVFVQHFGLHEAMERLLTGKKKQQPGALLWRQCSYCRCVMQTGQLLQTHVLTVHGRSTYQCAYCFYRALSQHCLLFHQLNVHSDKPLRMLRVREAPNAPKKTIMETSKNVLRPYLCEICVGNRINYKFYVTSEFYQHLVDRHACVTTYTCHICKDMLLKPDRLITHYKLHSYSMFQCAHCLHGTEVESEMMYHLSSYHCGEPVHMYVRTKMKNSVQSGVDGLSSLIVIEKENDIPGSDYVIDDTSSAEPSSSCPISSAKSRISMDLSSIVTELGINVTDESDQRVTPLLKELMTMGVENNETTVENILPNATFSSDVDSLSIPLGEMTPQMLGCLEAAGLPPTLAISEVTSVEKTPTESTHRLPQTVTESRSSKQAESSFTPMIQSVVSLAQPEKITLQPPVISLSDLALLDKPRPDKTDSFRESIKETLDRQSNMLIEKLARKSSDAVTRMEQCHVTENEDDVIVIDDDDEVEFDDVEIPNVTIRQEIEELRRKMSNETESLLLDADGVDPLSSSPAPLEVTTDHAILPLELAICSLNKKLEMEKAMCTELQSPSSEKESDKIIDVEGDNSSNLSFDKSEDGVETGYKSKSLSDLSGKDLYRCGNQDCDFSGMDGKELKEHMVVCDHSRNSLMLTCVHCKRQFRHLQPYLDHLRYHGIKRYLCYTCDFRSTALQTVKLHVRRVHRVGPNVKIVPVDPSKNNPDLDLFYVCTSVQNLLVPVEGKSSVYSPGEEDSLPQRAIYQEEVKCAICPYHTKVRSNMVRHLKFHSSAPAKGVKVPSTAPTNPVPCLENKEKMFDKMTNLAASSLLEQANKKTHNEQLSPEEEAKLPRFVPEHLRYKCSAGDCDYISVDETMLREHMKVFHNDVAWYSCPHCQSTVILEMRQVAIERIGIHLRFHDNKLYKCGYCAFYHHQKHTIEKHMSEKHSDKWLHYYVVREPGHVEQQTKCEDIVKEVADKTWRCNLCDEFVSAQRHKVADHLLKKHNTKSKYRCSMCNYKSSSAHNFNGHFASKHSGLKVVYHKTMEKVEVVEESETVEVEEFDTRPLWSRDSQRVRHIRGILIEDEEEVPKAEKKKKSLKRSLSNLSAEDLTLTKQVKLEKKPDIESAVNFPFNHKQFTCVLCKEEPRFSTKNELDFRYHLCKEMNFKNYTCALCSARYIDKREYKRHHRSSHPDVEESFVLNSDEEVTYYVDAVTNRQREEMVAARDKFLKRKKKNLHESKKSEDILSCPHCPFVSLDIVYLKQHLSRKHLVSGLYLCGYCRGTFISPNSANRHSQASHAGLPPKYWFYDENMNMDDFYVRNYFPQGVPARVKQFSCQFCSFDAFRRSDIAQHTEEVHRDLFVFDNEESTTEMSSKKRKLSHDEESIEVNTLETDEDTTNSSSKNDVDEPTTYTCPECSFTTVRLKTMNLHVLNHVDVIKCVSCNLTFKTSQDYESHVVTDDCEMIETPPCGKKIKEIRQNVLVTKGSNVSRGIGNTFLARKSTSKLPVDFKQTARKSTSKFGQIDSRFYAKPEPFDDNKLNTKIMMGCVETSISVNKLSKLMKLYPVVQMKAVESDNTPD